MRNRPVPIPRILNANLPRQKSNHRANGFEILEQFRGHGYALAACRAIAPLVRSIYSEVIVTCDTDNQASRKTIERLGARFLEEIAVDEKDPHYQEGRRKLRYQWTP